MVLLDGSGSAFGWNEFGGGDRMITATISILQNSARSCTVRRDCRDGQARSLVIDVTLLVRS